MKKLLFLLLFLTLYASAQAQIPPADVSGEWEIRLGVGPVLLVETNLGQVYRHVHYEQTALMEDGQYLQTRTEIGPCFPFGGPVLDGDIDDANVLTLNFTNGDQFAVLTSQLHLEIDDNRWDGTFTGTVCRQFYDTQPFIARRHLPFSSAYHRQVRPPRAFRSLALLSGVTFQEGENHSVTITAAFPSHPDGTPLVMTGSKIGAVFFASGDSLSLQRYHDGLDWNTNTIHIWGDGTVVVFTVRRPQ